MSDVTRMPAEELLPLVYEELRRLASRRLARESPGQTLQPTALVHEAYLRLLGPAGSTTEWNGRGHFFAAAAEAMRRILVERARAAGRQKRGGGRRRVGLTDLAAPEAGDDVLAIDEALTELESRDPAARRLAELRLFAGLSVADAAAAAGLGRSAGYELWAYARAFLRCELAE